MTRFAVLILTLVCLANYPSHAADKPNIVLVLIDDMGWNDLTCQGSKFYETPNIDRLASEGVRFINGYAACAVCSPTRAAIQTGRYPHRTGVTDWIRARFQGGKIPADKKNPCWRPKEQWRGRKVLCPPNALWLESKETTLAELLKPVGYTSCYIGKWHLGTDDWYPEKQGYDFNFGGCDYGQPPSYFDPYKGRKANGIHNLPSRKTGEFLSDREADEAVGFIRKHKDGPFFLMLAHYAVHTPIQAKAEVAAKYEKKGSTTKQKNAKYAAMVQSVDDAMGKVRATLDELDLTRKTIIIFTSDNGGLVGPTNNAPLRSGKGYPFEGGIRVPFIVKWPGVTRAGVTVDTPVISMDIFPTIAGATGAPMPNTEIDGQDLRPLLTGKGQFAKRTLYWHFPHYRHAPGPYSIIRDGDWKYIKWYEGPTALFNLKDDPAETKDLSPTMPERVAELDKKLMAHLTSVTDRIPIPNPNPPAPGKGKRKKKKK